MSEHPDYCIGLPQVAVASGTVLLEEGSTTGKLFILIDGEVQIMRGDVEVATVSQPGAVFGEMSVLLDAPHTASVRAVRATRAYVVDDARTFLQSEPGVALHIGRLLATRLQAASVYLADLKKQFADRGDHLGMVDEVLETLIHQQDSEFKPGSDREPDCCQ